mgnify:CR=1 FL=1
METPSLGPWGQFGLSGLVMGSLVMLVIYLLRRLVDGMLDQNKTFIGSMMGKLDEIKNAVSESREAQVTAMSDMRNDLMDMLARGNGSGPIARPERRPPPR